MVDSSRSRTSHLQPERRVLLLGATFNTSNLGVGALTAGALEVLDRADPAAEIAFLDYGRESSAIERRVGGRIRHIELLNLRFSWRPVRNNVILVLTLAAIASVVPRRFRRRVIALNRTLHAIDTAHAGYAVSGGDSFSDIYGLGRFSYVCFPQAIVVLLGKPLILLPQTIGPFRGDVAKWAARYLLHRSDRIFVRDHGGTAEVAALIGESASRAKVKFSYDLGFLLEPQAPASPLPEVTSPVRRARPVVGLNVSGLLWIGGYDHRNTFGLKVDYRALVDKLIVLAIEQLNADVLVIPHVLGDDAESDTSVSRLLGARHASRDDRFTVAATPLDQNEVKYVIGQCDLFVGARMHACIAALSQCIPAIGIAYSDKFTGVFHSLGVERLVADPRRHSETEILDIVRTAFDDRAALAALLQRRMSDVKGSVREMLVS